MSSRNKKPMLPTIAKGVPRLLNVNREPSRPKKRRKITVTFDENKRKEFLTGFQKRNLEKRQKAKERLAAKIKEEKKRITQEAKKKFQSYLSQRDIPELEELLAKHEYETDGRTVSILELNVNELTESANWIGENKPCYEKEESESEEEDTAEDDEDTVPGMELKEKKVKKSTDTQGNIDQPQLSKKAIAKEIMRKTHKSRLFKLKQQHECKRNKKRAEREKKQQELALKKARGKTKIKLTRQFMKKNDNNKSNKKTKK